METFREPAKEIQVYGEYEVVIIGGGCAGSGIGGAANDRGASGRTVICRGSGCSYNLIRRSRFVVFGQEHLVQFVLEGVVNRVLGKHRRNRSIAGNLN